MLEMVLKHAPYPKLRIYMCKQNFVKKQWCQQPHNLLSSLFVKDFRSRWTQSVLVVSSFTKICCWFFVRLDLAYKICMITFCLTTSTNEDRQKFKPCTLDMKILNIPEGVLPSTVMTAIILARLLMIQKCWKVKSIGKLWGFYSYFICLLFIIFLEWELMPSGNEE